MIFPTMFVNKAFLDQLITNQYRAIRYYLFFAASLIVLGIVVIVVASWFSGQLIPEAFKGLFGIGGAFVSSLSAFQIKEIIIRREKIAVFKIIKNRLGEREATDMIDETTSKRIDDLLWQVIEKTALR